MFHSLFVCFLTSWIFIYYYFFFQKGTEWKKSTLHEFVMIIRHRYVAAFVDNTLQDAGIIWRVLKYEVWAVALSWYTSSCSDRPWSYHHSMVEKYRLEAKTKLDNTLWLCQYGCESESGIHISSFFILTE